MGNSRRNLAMFLIGCFALLLVGCATSSGDAGRAVAQVEVPGQKPAIPQARQDLAELSAAASRLQAQIDKQSAEYLKGSRKRFISAGSAEHHFAQYEADWRAKIEHVGNQNYPLEQGQYGNVRVTVSLRSDGTVESATIDRSSGHEILDRAALRIVELASPFAPFPPEIRKDTDLLVITRTWFFTAGGKVNAK